MRRFETLDVENEKGIAIRGEKMVRKRELCCMEACPQVNDRSDFVGPHVFSLVRLYNLHPTGKMHASERLEPLMDKGGVADCGKAQNCVEVCPKEIPSRLDRGGDEADHQAHAVRLAAHVVAARDRGREATATPRWGSAFDGEHAHGSRWDFDHERTRAGVGLDAIDGARTRE